MSENRIARTFVGMSILLLLFFAWQIRKEYNPPYLPYQKAFKELLIQKAADAAEIQSFKIGVRQRWIDKLNRVDRCETCHLGIEDPRFIDAPQPFTMHPGPDTHAIEQFGCTVCHGGQGLATSLEDSHGPSEVWYNAIYHENFMENSCSLCHGDLNETQAPVLARGREMFKDLGCRGCHKVLGMEKVKIGPPLEKLETKVKIDWLYRWLKDPKDYLPKPTMPDFKLPDQEAADIARFLLSPRRIPDTGSVINGSYDRGKKIFSESRCVSCHMVEGRGGSIGPELSKISSKMNPQWLFRWIKDPQKVWPDTKMSDFSFEDRDVEDLVAFLVEEYIDLDMEEASIPEQIKKVNTADYRRGKELILKYGCIGCHDISGEEDRGETGLELTAISDIHPSKIDFGTLNVILKDFTIPNWLYNKMKQPRSIGRDSKMPDYRFSDQDAEALTTYLLSLKSEDIPRSYTLMLGNSRSEYDPQGGFGRIVKSYRCLICHTINGRGGKMAPDLSQEGSRIRKAWLKDFLRIPYAIRPILVDRMTRFRMSDSEIETVYSYFQSTLIDDRVEDLSVALEKIDLDDPGRITRGKDLYYEKYACHACHQINLKGGTIGPDLTAAGDRLRPEWVAHYLRNPKAFSEQSVEPVYNFSENEIEDLTAFLIHSKEQT